MNIAADIILVLLCLATVARYTIKGFAKTVLDVIAFVVSTAVAWTLTPILFSNSSFLTRMIANILIFLMVYVILSVVFSIVNKIFKLPIIGTLNRFLGFLFGLLCAYIQTSFFVSVLSVIVYMSENASEIANSFMYRLFSEYGAFALVEKIFIQ